MDAKRAAKVLAGLEKRAKAPRGAKGAKGLPAWAEAFTPRDWQRIKSVSEEVRDEFAMTGSADPQDIMTSQGYVEVSSNFVTAFGAKVNRKDWP